MVQSSPSLQLEMKIQGRFKNYPWHAYSFTIDLATYLMKLVSSEINRIAQTTATSLCFFVSLLSSDLVVVPACSRFFSLCFVAG